MLADAWPKFDHEREAYRHQSVGVGAPTDLLAN